MPKRQSPEAGGERREAAPTFAGSLHALIAQPLTPMNSATYFDDALDELTTLIDAVTHAYKTQHPSEKATGAELEDKAFEEFGLQAVPDILSTIGQAQVSMRAIEERITTIAVASEVYVPPVSKNIEHGDGTGPPLVGGLRGRLRTLLYVLKSEGASVENTELVPITEGHVTEKMYRRTPYTKVVVPELNRAFLVCDEEGNVTFVFDLKKLEAILRDGQDIARMQKPELDALIDANPDIGTRLRQSVHWVEHLRSRISDEFSFADANDERTNFVRPVLDTQIPVVSAEELDPWRGFWCDEQGKHWGSPNQLARKLSETLHHDISYHVVRERAQSSGIPKKKVRPTAGPARDMNSYEDVLPLFEDYAAHPQIVFETEGDWKGFHIAADGRHFAGLQSIEDRLAEEGYNAFSGSIYRMIITNPTVSFSFLQVMPQAGHRALTGSSHAYKAYCYEEFLPYFVKGPRLVREGDFAGFYITDTGEYYGAKTAIAAKLGFSPIVFKGRLKDYVNKIPTLDFGRRSTDKVYSYDRVEELTREFRTLPAVAETGEWSGFLEEDGKHYGALFAIAKRVTSRLRTNGVSTALGTVNTRLIAIRERAGLPAKALRDPSGQELQGYAYEDLEPLYFAKFPVE